MHRKLSLIDCTSVLFLLFINAEVCLRFTQLNISNSILNGSIVVAVFFIICGFFKLTKVQLSGIIFAILFFFVAVFIYIYTGMFSAFVMVLWLLIARGLTYKKIISYHNKILLIIFIMIMISSLIGLTNMYWISTSDKISYRQIVYTFGFDNPNTPPVIIFSLIAGYNLLKNSIVNVKTLFVEFVIFLIAFYLFQSRTLLVSALIYIFSLLFLQKSWNFSLVKWLFKPLQYLFLIETIFAIYVSVNFDILNSTWQDLNLLLSGRLFLWQSFIKTYGFQLFGNNLFSDTSGFTAALDNGFIFLLMRYGICMLALYNFMFIYVSKYAYKTENIILFLTTIAFEVYCFSESTVVYFNFSPILLCFASLIMNGGKYNISVNKINKE